MSEILTDRLVARLDEDSKRFPEYMRTLLNGQVERLCASHRLLSARVKELEMELHPEPEDESLRHE
ncbi:hypothetical protein LCGC14_3109240 [marine sediment metagenome]|uniref:Uncharacterized protein n=1 Tax=marine sediment metagenome TaxID=412755 RepID=A0A0F8YD02_9ZZZZ